MTTAAKVTSRSSSRWYWPDGTPCYELKKKTSEGTKQPTLTDARQLGLLPSVTTILKILHKPNLQDWLIEQAVLAVMTTPQRDGETRDEFVHRVLTVDRVQDQEADAAADRGKLIHDALEKAVKNEEYPASLLMYVSPVLSVVRQLGRVVWTEKHLVGDGYAGRADILLQDEHTLTLLDFKTAKTMPKKQSWSEHMLQTAAYAQTLGNTESNRIVTGNIYISTTTPGEVALFLQSDWQLTYANGFRKLVDYWQWVNAYCPGKIE